MSRTGWKRNDNLKQKASRGDSPNPFGRVIILRSFREPLAFASLRRKERHESHIVFTRLNEPLPMIG
jgi:hypothetical protein